VMASASSATRPTRESQMRRPAELSTNQIEQLKGGNMHEFEALYDQYKQTVYALCLRNLHNASDAEDLTQDVFLQVHRRISTLRNYAALKSWLYRVTTNVILMHFRKRDVLAMSLHYVQDPKTLAVLDIAEMLVTPGCEPIERVALARAIGDLPKCRRAVVVLHDIKGMSHREIAEFLGVSLTTAKSNLSRARRQLRGALCDHSSITRTRNSVCLGVYDSHDDFN
jgi:RNA polymerase sigma-70 factor, ECF subfamily